MGLFQDDFYSTKILTKDSRSFKRRSFHRNGWMSMAALSAAGGALLVMLVIWLSAAVVKEHAPAIATMGSANLGTTEASASAFDDVDEDHIVAAVAKVQPDVVSVINYVKSDKTGAEVASGLGSGVIFQLAGDKVMIFTNSHVVEGGTSFEVVLPNNEHRTATLVGRDIWTDLAVLEIDAKGIRSVAQFGNSDILKSGQTAIAIGNPLGLDLSQTITMGIISSPKRTITTTVSNSSTEWNMDFIQTDASINEGNSGGPLINIRGEVIGINTLKVAQTGVEGLGFSIPINEAKPILALLIRDHKIKRPYMGITPDDLQTYKDGPAALKLPDSVKTGVVVIEAVGPAESAGLKTGDVIVALDGQVINNSLELRQYLFNRKKIGDSLTVIYYRDGHKETLEVTLGELPDSDVAGNASTGDASDGGSLGDSGK